MNTTWQEITQVMEVGLSIRVQQLLAQQSPNLAPEQVNGFNYVQGTLQQVFAFLPRLVGAVAILLIGWLVAVAVAAGTRSLLNRTNLDNQIAAGITGGQRIPQLESVISRIVFWGIFLLTIVAVLDTLELRVASQPLNSFLNQIGDFLPKLAGALIILAIAWLVATIVKLITLRGMNALQIDERLNPQPPEDQARANQVSLSETISNALYWFIFLLFLIPLLDTLDLDQALQPVQLLVTEILSILPNVLGATLIAVVGWFIARIVRQIVTNLLATTGIDGLGERFGLSTAAGTQPLSTIIGTIVYILILLPVAIAALNQLQIQAISVPAIAMLQQILNALPAIFTAIAILILAYFFGRFLADLVTNILTSIGFNNIFAILGLPSPTRRIVIPEEPTESRSPSRTPSEIAGIVVLVGIMLFATVAAVNILNIPALTVLVTGIVVILGRILAGLIVFAVGLFLANLAFNLITSSGSSQARILGQVARVSIIALVSAMALQQIGIAPDIVNLAFGLLLGAIAVAIALSFGLGAREIARDQVQEWLNSFKHKS